MVAKELHTGKSMIANASCGSFTTHRVLRRSVAPIALTLLCRVKT